MKRTAIGIWHCKHCKKTVAGGAWTVATPAGSTTRRYVFLEGSRTSIKNQIGVLMCQY